MKSITYQVRGLSWQRLLRNIMKSTLHIYGNSSQLWTVLSLLTSSICDGQIYPWDTAATFSPKTTAHLLVHRCSFTPRDPKIKVSQVEKQSTIPMLTWAQGWRVIGATGSIEGAVQPDPSFHETWSMWSVYKAPNLSPRGSKLGFSCHTMDLVKLGVHITWSMKVVTLSTCQTKCAHIFHNEQHIPGDDQIFWQ